MNKPLKIFITYAHKDKLAKDKLAAHLQPMTREGLIDIWNEHAIAPDDTPRDATFSNLAESGFLLYLVSASSFASEACRMELANALSEKITVIPVILERCDWMRHPLSGYKTLPEDGKPINEWFPESNGWQNVAAGLRKVVRNVWSQAELGLQQGNVFMMIGQTDKAIDSYSHVIALNSSDADAYFNRGAAYHKKGEFVYAIQDYSVAIGLNPEYAEAYTRRGIAYFSKTDIHRAIEDYNTAINLDPDAGFAYGNCGIARLHLRHWGNARVDLTVAVTLRVNIAALFHDIYKSVADFERKTAIQLPEDIAAMLTSQTASNELEKENRLALALKGYETGKLSTGLAARLAGVPYSEFLLLMSRHELSPFGETAEELASDAANAHRASYH